MFEKLCRKMIFSQRDYHQLIMINPFLLLVWNVYTICRIIVQYLKNRSGFNFFYLT